MLICRNRHHSSPLLCASDTLVAKQLVWMSLHGFRKRRGEEREEGERERCQLTLWLYLHCNWFRIIYIFRAVNDKELRWNLSITDTLGATWSVLIKEVYWFQRLFSKKFLCVTGTAGSRVLLTREMSLIQRSLLERFHCKHENNTWTEFPNLEI